MAEVEKRPIPEELKGAAHVSDSEFASEENADSLELTPKEYKRLRRIVDWRILPYCSLLYLLSFLDRVNIGQARLAGLEKDLKLHGQQYDIALTVFFVSYVAFEIPSNLALKWLKPHRWITFIMVSWSIVMTLMGTVHNFGGLTATRFMLGLAEGGLFPGLNFVLTTWYNRNEQNWVISLFFAGSTLAGAFGGILAYGIRHMAGDGGKDGWAWIFILEGLFTFVCAIPAWWLIPDFPEDERVLKGIDQKRWSHRLLQNQGVTNTPIGFNFAQVKRAFGDWKNYVYALMYIGIAQPFYSLALFTPSIIAALGYTNANANLLSVPPYVLGFITTLAVGWMSDRSLKRGWYIIGGMVITIVGYIIQLCDVSPGAKYFGIFLCVGGVSPCIATCITWIGNNVGPVYTRAAAMGMLFSSGNSAGIISSNVYPKSTAPRYFEGHGVAVGFSFMAIACAVIIMIANSRENARRDRIYGPAHPEDATLAKSLEPERRAKWGLENMSEEEIITLGDHHPAYRYII